VLRHFGQQKIYKAAATEDTSRTEHGKTPQNNKKIQTDLTQTQTNKTWTGKTKKNKERETTGKQMAAGKAGEKVLRVFVCVCDPVQVFKNTKDSEWFNNLHLSQFERH